MSAAPVIGMTTYVEQSCWNANEAPAVVLHDTYPRMMALAGGVPLLIPPLYAVAASAEPLLERLDALVITGGPDIDPAQYGQRAHAQTSRPRRERDAAELTLMSAAVDAGMPVLCICRGMQLLNVARGGTLVQHLPDVVGHHEHAPAPGMFGRHTVLIEPGSQLARVLEQTKVDVATLHHQGIDELGEDLLVTARAEDGTIEAVEDTRKDFLLGVQWHPEAGTDLELMRGLAGAAIRYRTSRGS
jgi:putative glutamine amidotransferase